MLKNPRYENLKAENKKEIGRKAIRTLSRELQESLCRDLSVDDKSRFDKALNALKLDDKTRASLLAEVRDESPGLRPAQAEKLVARCFRRKVNTLRCLGQRVLLTVLDEVLPGAAKAALEAAIAAEAEAAEAAEAKPTGERKRRGEKRWRRRKEAAAPAAEQSAVVAPCSEADDRGHTTLDGTTAVSAAVAASAAPVEARTAARAPSSAPDGAAGVDGLDERPAAVLEGTRGLPSAEHAVGPAAAGAGAAEEAPPAAKRPRLEGGPSA